VEILIAAAEAISEINPLIPYYHVVSNEELPHIRHLHPYKNASQFLKDIDYLGKNFGPIELSDLLDFIKKGKKLKKRSLFITFDDGYSECYSIVAPILYKKGIPAAFFVCSDLIDNKSMSYKNKASLIVERLLKKNEKNLITLSYLRDCSSNDYIKMILNVGYKERNVLDEIAEHLGINWEYYLKAKQPYLTSLQINEMENMGFYFGAHSLDHANFSELNIEEQIYQAKSSIDLIKQRFNIDYSLFAFPFSDKNIPLEFFRRMRNYIDISFGTAGTQLDKINWNLERINFERSLRPADEIYLKKLLKKKANLIQGKGNIQRPR
jgi:peptidoglycan/xylan/chitin deacetylase (PgdA/CDA1 family)